MDEQPTMTAAEAPQARPPVAGRLDRQIQAQLLRDEAIKLMTFVTYCHDQGAALDRREGWLKGRYESAAKAGRSLAVSLHRRAQQLAA